MSANDPKRTFEACVSGETSRRTSQHRHSWHARTMCDILQLPVFSVSRTRVHANVVTCVRKSLGLLFYDRGPLCVPNTQEAIEQTFSASLPARRGTVRL